MTAVRAGVRAVPRILSISVRRKRGRGREERRREEEGKRKERGPRTTESKLKHFAISDIKRLNTDIHTHTLTHSHSSCFTHSYALTRSYNAENSQLDRLTVFSFGGQGRSSSVRQHRSKSWTNPLTRRGKKTLNKEEREKKNAHTHINTHTYTYLIQLKKIHN